MKKIKFLINGLLCFCLLTLTACNENSCSHQYDWYVSKAVTCTKNGIMEGICKKCGNKSFEEVLSVGHLYENGVCSECGSLESNISNDGGTPSDEQATLDALTFDEIYQTATTLGFCWTKEEYKNYLVNMRISNAYIGGLGQIRADISGIFNETIGTYNYSVTLPITRVDYKMNGGGEEIISSIDINQDGSLYLISRDGTYKKYGYVDEYIDTSLPVNANEKTIVGIAVNKENALLFKLKDGSVYKAGYILQDPTDVSEDVLFYERIGNAYQVVGAMRRDIKNIVVPSTHRGLPVTTIKKSAFFGYENLESISLSNSQITTISHSAFAYCTKLKTITFDKTVKYHIEDYAFYCCTSLSDDILDGLQAEHLGYYIFLNCTSFKEIHFGSTSLTFLGIGMFYGCTGLTTIDFSNSDIEEISTFAFKNCTSLTTVKMPENTSLSIGFNAFYNTPFESLLK